jgi:hypothetical protein
MTKEAHDIIDRLSVLEARSILKALAQKDTELSIRIREMALSCLAQVNIEEIAGAVYAELDALEVEEVWDRAGPSRYGYVDPGEAADEMIQQVLDPFLFELDKYHKLGMNTEANKVCMGLLLGIYRFDDESTTEFKNWAPDSPAAVSESVVDAWKKGKPSRTDIKAVRQFIEGELAGWGDSLV